MYKTLSKVHTHTHTHKPQPISLNFSQSISHSFLTKFPIFPLSLFLYPFPDLFFTDTTQISSKAVSTRRSHFASPHLFPSIRNEERGRGCPFLVFLGLLPLIFHSPVSFSAKRIGILRETKRPDEISPRGKRRDQCKAFYCGGRPRFRSFAPPSPFTRNYRERTPGTRTRKETSR